MTRTLLTCDFCPAGLTMPRAISPRAEIEARNWVRVPNPHGTTQLDACPRCAAAL